MRFRILTADGSVVLYDIPQSGQGIRSGLFDAYCFQDRLYIHGPGVVVDGASAAAGWVVACHGALVCLTNGTPVGRVQRINDEWIDDWAAMALTGMRSKDTSVAYRHALVIQMARSLVRREVELERHIQNSERKSR